MVHKLMTQTGPMQHLAGQATLLTWEEDGVALEHALEVNIVVN